MSWFKKRKVKKYWIVWWQVSFSQTWIITWLMHYFTPFIEPPIDTFCIFFSSHSVLNKTILQTFENEKRDHVLVIYHKFSLFSKHIQLNYAQKVTKCSPLHCCKKNFEDKIFILILRKTFLFDYPWIWILQILIWENWCHLLRL